MTGYVGTSNYPVNCSTRLQICPLYIFGNKPPQLVPKDLNIGFQGFGAWLRVKSATLWFTIRCINSPTIICVYKGIILPIYVGIIMNHYKDLQDPY